MEYNFVLYIVSLHLTLLFIGYVQCENLVIEHRLEPQEPPARGLLLIRRSGRGEAWGTVCDDGWMNPANAQVACRALGYDDGRDWPQVNPRNDSLPIYLDDTVCDGTETSLADCQHGAWGVSDCSYTENVGISCSSKEHFLVEARLRGGSQANSGLLEVRQKGNASAEWGTVCDDNWDGGNHSNVLVACRSMGHKWGLILPEGQFPLGSGPIYLDNVECRGDEANLANCSRNMWGDQNCQHYEDIGLVCYDTTVGVPRISADRAYGTVSLVLGNTVYDVCDSGWTQQNAKVACRSLGYQYYKELCCSQFDTSERLSTTSQSIRTMSCTGDEASLDACPRTLQNGTCSYKKQASVVCSKTPIPAAGDVPVRLMLDASREGTSWGKVQVQRFGMWVDVCGKITDKEAQVVCKQKGFSTGWVLGTWDVYNALSDSSPFKNLSCQGTETNIRDCTYDWSNDTYCPRTWRPAVICSTLANEAAECRRTKLGTEYMGLQNTSTSGRRCQRWDSQFPHEHVYNVSDTFPDGDVSDANNYCRNPDGWEYGLWCYTTDPDKRWDTCTLPMCNSTDCRYDVLALHYRGTQSHTRDGLSCQRWDSQTPHKHDYDKFFTDVEAAQDYCRNPDGHHEGAWCYTRNPAVRWQLCDIPYCSFGCKQTEVGTEYTGHVHLTASGRVCQRWDTDRPHANIYQHYYDKFPDDSPTEAENFCRNPSKEEEGPWCYTMDAAVEKERCRIPRCSSIQARLADGGTNYGRVEVRYDNVWGRVCDTSFGEREATVLCKQLGFWSGEAKRNSLYGTGTGPVYLDGLDCNGDEDNIIKCSTINGFRNVSDWCTTGDRDAGVVCHGKARLKFGGNLYAERDHISGMVEVMKGNNWAPICGTDWNDTDAKVVCKELGYNFGRALCCSSFGSQWTWDMLGSVSCTGSEASILDCPSSNQSCSTSWQNYASVYCSKKQISTMTAFTISLDHGSAGYEDVNGKIVVHRGGQVGAVCGQAWTDENAGVACRQLGLAGGVAFAMEENNGFGDEHQYPVLLSGVQCAGTETSLDKCQYRNSTTCGSAVRAGLLCYRGTQGVKYRLQGGPSDSQGRVEISYNGVWGTVCINAWSRYDARALCRQFGYVGGETMWNTFGTIDAPRYIGGLKCTSVEPTLLMCRNGGWRANLDKNCTQAAVACYNTTRLAFSIPSQYHVIAGQVRGYIQSRWDLVCGTGFDQVDATVACRSLGFAHARKEPGLYPVKSASANVFSNVRCAGTETTIMDCQYDHGPRESVCPDVLVNQAVAICSSSALTESVWTNYTNGGVNHTGFLLATIYGIRGPVCWALFDHNAAEVTCKAAGFKHGMAQKSVLTYLLRHRWIIQFKCTGSERNVTQCQKVRSKDNARKCNDEGANANVVCYNQMLSFYVSGSASGLGRVEVNHDGVKGMVCCIACTNTVAKVACRSMGFTSGNLVSSSQHTGSTTDTLLVVYTCTGDEDSLLSCSSRWVQGFDYSCDSDSRMAVQCIKDSAIEGGKHTGVVQYSYQGSLVEVCSDSFTDNDAKVVCRAGGFQFDGKPVKCGNFPIRGTEVVSRFGCTGLEAVLSECRPQIGSAGQCASGQAAAVSCMYNQQGGLQGTVSLSVAGTVVIMDQYRSQVGVLMVNVSGVAAPVGADGWNDDQALKACTTLGYQWGIAYKHAPLPTRIPFISSGITCPRGEENFLSCLDKSAAWAGDRCNASVSAGVICLPSAYLVPFFQIESAGGGVYAGRLVLMWAGARGAVCSDGFSDTEATVHCRSMGKTFGRVSTRVFPRLEQILIEGIRCSGREQRLFECTYGGIDDNICPSGQQVAIECYDEVYIDGGPGLNYGMVQVKLGDVTHTVCDDTFDDVDAKVVCRAAGFQDGVKVCCQPFGANPRSQPSINNVRCSGSEKSLVNCTYDKSTCTSGLYSSVYCSTRLINTDAAPAARVLGNDMAQQNGEVALFYQGLWGRICSDLWDDTDATVLCKRFGYAGGVAYQFQQVLKNPILWGQVNCSGNEAALVACPHANVARTGGCSNYRYSAGVLCYRQSAPQLRLVGGTDEGRVEINYDGVWGTVCNERFSATDARVVCKQINTEYVDGIVGPISKYGQGSGPIYLTRLACGPEDKSLFSCLNTGWMVTAGCDHSRDAAVQCFRNVRLTDGDQGQVLVWQENKWKKICDNGFDRNAANVVCRSRGFAAGFPLCCSAYGAGSSYYETAFTQTSCTGTENSYLECQNKPGDDCSGDDQYASVHCYNGAPQTGYTSIRLSSGDRYSGVVEIKYQGTWGRICTDGWDDTDARVVCRELGYSNGMAYKHYRDFWDSGSGLFWTSNIGCNGGESKLQDCRRERYGNVLKCSSKHAAGVLCYRNTGVYFRLEGNPDCPAGRACTDEGTVKVQVNGTWGNICEYSWSDADASVFCKSIQYTSGISISGVRSQRSPGDIVWKNEIYCKGDERTLLECPHTAFKKELEGNWDTCSADNDAAVYCYKGVRLYNTSTTMHTKSGSLHVYNNNKWSPVCATNFTDALAARACRELGYAGGTAVCCNAIGFVYSQGTVFSDVTTCGDQHTSMTQCARNATNCTEYASVICATRQQLAQKDVFTFSLEPGSSASSGRLLVTNMGETGRVCSTGWDDTDAAVFCKSKGFAFGIAQRLTEHQYARHPYFVAGVRCTGSEAGLEDCPRDTGMNLGNCSHVLDAGVYCYNSGTITYRLGAATVPGLDAAIYGRVEVGFQGVWGTVCDKYWDARDATVFCRSIGYNGGDPLYRLSGGEGRVWMSHLRCTGQEKALHACGHPGFNNSFTAGISYCSSHTTDAGVVCYNAVRLNQLLTRYRLHIAYGTVLAHLPDGWGGICDDQWDDVDAKVVCKELGYDYGRAVPRSSFGLPEVETDKTYTAVSCVGSEKTVYACSKQDSRGCRNYAGVYCSATPLGNQDYQLNTSIAGGQGIVNMYRRGVFGRICKNKWGLNEAAVACRQMGFKGGVPYAHPTLDVRPIVRSNVTCLGTEPNLQTCTGQDWGDAYACRADRYEAGVLCYNSTFAVRLSSGSHGRVDVEYDGRWGTVCNYGFRHDEARVVCKQMGYKDGIVPDKEYPKGQGPVWLSMVDCDGEEPHLLACPNSGWAAPRNQYYCGAHQNDAKVKCLREKIAITKVRLADGDGVSYGRVEVFASGAAVWGTVCDDGWDEKDATVVCRMMGYNKGEALLEGKFGSGVGQILMDDVNCTGTEQSLNECSYPGIGDNNCHHEEDAAVKCSDPVAPTPGPTSPPSTPTTPQSTTEPITTKPTSAPPTQPPRPTQSSTTPGEGSSTGARTANGGAIAAGIIIPILLLCAAAVVGFFLYRRYSTSIPRRPLENDTNSPVAIDNVLYGMNLGEDTVIPSLGEQASVDSPGITIDNKNLVKYAAPISHNVNNGGGDGYSNETYA